MKKSLSPLLAFLLQKKIFIPFALLLTLAATGVAIKFYLDYKTRINFELLQEQELEKCQTDNRSINVKITKPDTDSEFKKEDTIELEGSYEYICSGNSDFETNWSLDNGEAFSNELNPTLPLYNISEGEHIVKLTVSNDKISNSGEIKIKVATPEVKGEETVVQTPPPAPTPVPQPQPVPQPTPQPTPPPAPIPNEKPTVSIRSPKEGQVYEARYERGGCNYYTDIDLAGIGTDKEDGSLSNGSLRWFMDGQQIGTGNSWTYKMCTGTGYYPVNHTVTLRGYDSKGEYGEQTITIVVYPYYIIG